MNNWRQKIIKEALEWVGTPYKHYTVRKGLGVDCGLFILQVYANAGLITYKMPEFYPEDWAFHSPIGELFEAIVKKYCIPVESKDLQIGDLILYKFGKSLSHASLLMEHNMIIHSETNIGVRVSNREHSHWYKRERKYYTYVK
jgi:cell wall-associated NlpC family hydrolase